MAVVRDTTAPFFALPGELRNRIYEYTFTPHADVPDAPYLLPPASILLQLLLTCRQFYSEASLVAFSSVTFTITSGYHQEHGAQAGLSLDQRLSILQPWQIQTIHSLCFADSNLISPEWMEDVGSPLHVRKHVLDTLVARHVDLEEIVLVHPSRKYHFNNVYGGHWLETIENIYASMYTYTDTLKRIIVAYKKQPRAGDIKELAGRTKRVRWLATPLNSPDEPQWSGNWQIIEAESADAIVLEGVADGSQKIRKLSVEIKHMRLVPG